MVQEGSTELKSSVVEAASSIVLTISVHLSFYPLSVLLGVSFIIGAVQF